VVYWPMRKISISQASQEWDSCARFWDASQCDVDLAIRSYSSCAFGLDRGRNRRQRFCSELLDSDNERHRTDDQCRSQQCAQSYGFVGEQCAEQYRDNRIDVGISRNFCRIAMAQKPEVSGVTDDRADEHEICERA